MTMWGSNMIWTLTYLLWIGCFLQSFASEDPTIVITNEGPIRGIEEVSIEGKSFISFMGIPFAKPPVGNLRFKKPIPIDPWEDIRDTTKMPPMCSQYFMFDSALRAEATQFGQEDCLYLNVYTSQPNDRDANLPVMVFFHGGAYYCGCADHYPPHVLLNKDVVLVVPQYRLGILGFLSTEDSVLPGNYGMRDQVLALEWVQKNIKHFGGNPNTVTIFGESAGAGSVSLHMLSPLSRGLFHRAITQSGSSVNNWVAATQFKNYAIKIGKEVNCSIDNGSEDFLQCLLKIDAKELTTQLVLGFKWGTGPLDNVPRVDGEFLPDLPSVLLSQGKINEVDFMSGITRDEGAFITLFFLQHDYLIKDFESKFEEVAQYTLLVDKENDPIDLSRKIRDYYFHGMSTGRDSLEQINAMISDSYFTVGHDITAMYITHNQKLSKTFLYELTYEGDFSLTDLFPTIEIKKRWVSHIDDLIYLFHGGSLFPNIMTNPNDILMRANMVELWTNFARYGNPTPDNSLGFNWQPASLDSFKHLVLNIKPSMDINRRKEIREFWTSLDIHNMNVLNADKNFQGLLNRISSNGLKDEL